MRSKEIGNDNFVATCWSHFEAVLELIFRSAFSLRERYFVEQDVLSTEAEIALLTQEPWVRISVLPKGNKSSQAESLR